MDESCFNNLGGVFGFYVRNVHVFFPEIKQNLALPKTRRRKCNNSFFICILCLLPREGAIVKKKKVSKQSLITKSI